MRAFITLTLLLSGCLNSFENSERRPSSQIQSCAQAMNHLLATVWHSTPLSRAIFNIHPTQFGYGRPKVDFLKKVLKKQTLDEVQDFVNSKPIPYISGPNGKKYIIDRHHTFRALSELEEEGYEKIWGGQISLKFNRLESYRESHWNDFYNSLKQKRWLLLNFKGQKKSIHHLPNNINGLRLDYYRGLAWFLLKSRVVLKTDIPFNEFTWARELEKHIQFKKQNFTRKKVKKAIREVLKNPERYKHLPGFQTNSVSLSKALENLEDIFDVLDM